MQRVETRPEQRTGPSGSSHADGADTTPIDWADVYRRLVVYCRTAFRFGDEAEDVAQEVIARLVEHEHDRDPSRPFLPWCYRFARNRAIDLLRSRRRQMETVRDPQSMVLAGSEADRPDVRLERRELEAEVARFLDGLDPSDRELAFLRFFEELPYRDIARVTGRVPGTVRYRIHSVRKRLADQLRNRGYDGYEG